MSLSRPSAETPITVADWASRVQLNLPVGVPAQVESAAAAFVSQWGLCDQNSPNARPRADSYQLTYAMDAWQLFPPAQRDGLGKHPLWVDFVHNPRFAQTLLLREPLAKAAGLRANQRPLVIDLTAGLGRDTWALASTGCPVLAFERHPLVHFLLNDGLLRARAHPKTRAIAERIALHRGDARQYEGAFIDQNNAIIDPIWLVDPMFPERQKSALVKKDMRIFHQLVGEDLDASALFNWARTQSGSRWIVKRPPQAPALNEESPALVITSGRVRFDCYLPIAVSARK
ncbi:MAG: class I SAM-dependent methyltransferase [Halothiobacillaceae bacterium]|nr:class I SAM-dependent methyltransferase [Halothiobacillaceae bacterium]